MRVVFRNKLKEKMNREAILALLYFPVTYPLALKRKMMGRIERRVISLRKWKERAPQRKTA